MKRKYGTTLNNNENKILNRNLNRRQFSKLILGLGLSASSIAYSKTELFSWSEFGRQSQDTTLLCSAQGNHKKNFSFDIIDSENTLSVPSNFRGHGLNQHPINNEFIVCMPRRPGITGLVINIQLGKVAHSFSSASEHHMNGHACFSFDGLYLFTTESNFETSDGVIVVRETQRYQVISSFPSYGIGPHELAMMPDGKTLVVANGGLRTHPDSGRKVLNLNTMASNLSYIDTRTGTLIDQARLNDQSNDFSKASIRHLDVSPCGTVAIALQVHREAMSHDAVIPLAAIHKQNKAISVLNAPSQLLRKLDDYMGSVKINSHRNTVAFTSPKGDMAMFWDMNTKIFNGFHVFHDVCGLTVSNDHKFFILSNSAGKIRYVNAITLQEDKDKRLNYPDKHWDNHLLSAIT
jgi:hypothetical protein